MKTLAQAVDDAPEFITDNEDGSKTYVLAFVGPDGLEALTLRRGRGGDYEAQDAAKGTTDKQCAMIAALSGVKALIILDLDGYDVAQLNDIVEWFEKNAPSNAPAILDAVTNPDGSVVIPLAAPLKSEGKDLTEVTIRRLRPSDMKASEQVAGAGKRTIEMICRLTNIPRSTVRKLDAYDFVRINNTVADFLQKRPETGARPS